MREVKVRILDEDTVSDLVSYLDELEADLAKAQKHLEDLKGILGGTVEVAEKVASGFKPTTDKDWKKTVEDQAMPEDEPQIDVEALAVNIKELQRTLEKLLNSKWHISECTLGEERSWTATREKNGL